MHNSFIGQESHMIKRFTKEMYNLELVAKKKTIWRGLINSITQVIPFVAYGVALSYGGFMVANEEIHYKDVIRLIHNLKSNLTCDLHNKKMSLQSLRSIVVWCNNHEPIFSIRTNNHNCI